MTGTSRAQVWEGECIRMEAATEYLDAEQFLKTDITEMNPWAKMFKEGKLAGFVGGLKHRDIEAKLFGEAVGISSIERAFSVEHAYSPCALPGLDDKLHRSRIQPPVAASDGVGYTFLGKGAFMLLAHLVLHGQPPLVSHLKDD